MARKYLENLLIGAKIVGFAGTYRIQFLLKSNDVTIQETMASNKRRKVFFFFLIVLIQCVGTSCISH